MGPWTVNDKMPRRREDRQGIPRDTNWGLYATLARHDDACWSLTKRCKQKARRWFWERRALRGYRW
jgi:hypothetical protein